MLSAERSFFASDCRSFQPISPFSTTSGRNSQKREAVADEVGRRGDRRRAHALVDQRDLAEVVARAEARALGAAHRDGRLARLDQEERGAVRALLHDRLAGREVPLLEEQRDLRELVVVEVGEERHALQRIDRCARHQPPSPRA